MVPQCPAFIGGLSPVLYWLLVPAPHASKWSNLWRPPEISLISVKPEQSLFLLIGVLSKNRKNKNDHYHCPISVFILLTSKLEAILEDYRCSLKLVKSSVSGGGGLSSATPSTCLASRYSGGSLRLCAHGGTLSLFYQCLFLLLYLSRFRSKLDGG
jgi:hypothetical protein